MATAIKKPTYQTTPTASPAGTGSSSSGRPPSRPGRPHRPVTNGVTYLVREPPIISSYDDAVVHHSFKGDQAENIWFGGALNGLGYATPEVSGSYYFRIKTGYGTIFGRQFEIDENYDINMSALTGKKYCVVYVEINLKSVTNSIISVKLVYAGANYPDVSTDDLIERKQGIARMPLYRFIYTASGSSRFSAITKLFYTYSNGIAEKARMMASDGKWNGRTLSNLFYYNADRFKKGEHAWYADLAKAIGTTGAWKAYSDLLEIKHDDESEQRQILCVTSNVFRVKGLDAESKIGSGNYLIENRSYKFYYEGGGNPIPANARVVGIIVEGSIKLFYWNGGWKAAGGNQYMSLQHEIHDAWPNWGNTPHYPGSECHMMYTPNLWYREQDFYIGQDHYQKDLPIGVQVGAYGQIMSDGTKKCYINSIFDKMYYPLTTRQCKLTRLKFQATDKANPYIDVKVGDDCCLDIDVTFRLLYVLGTEQYKERISYDNWDTNHEYPIHSTYVPSPANPFTNLDPQLEGGQT